ncbi:hypothetical protein BJY01DRAFT_247139 [Aspergillus pseudoustus]|uniref:Uncharacterized protein n=1 Tax=Aspergillus pseudoustus TaxID=1810923 RepID=A0ABR4K305_9EURO
MSGHHLPGPLPPTSAAAAATVSGPSPVGCFEAFLPVEAVNAKGKPSTSVQAMRASIKPGCHYLAYKTLLG